MTYAVKSRISTDCSTAGTQRFGGQQSLLGGGTIARGLGADWVPG